MQVVKSLETPVLKPGKNRVLIDIPPQRPGSYVLGALTGHLGQVRLRSHTYCSTSAASSKGGPPGSDDVLSYEKPLRPVLEVCLSILLLTLSAGPISRKLCLASVFPSSINFPLQIQNSFQRIMDFASCVWPPRCCNLEHWWRSRQQWLQGYW